MIIQLMSSEAYRRTFRSIGQRNDPQLSREQCAQADLRQGTSSNHSVIQHDNNGEVHGT